MACNCKRAKKFQEKYGVPEEEGILDIVVRKAFKVFFLLVALLIAVVAVPYVVIYAVYSIFFGDNKITLPKFLRKYLE